MLFARYHLLYLIIPFVLLLAACGQRPPIETSILPSANESATPFFNVQVASAQSEQTPTAELAVTIPTLTPATLAPVSSSTSASTLAAFVRTATPRATRGATLVAQAQTTVTTGAASCFGSINGSVVADLNGNGQAESGEPGVQGAKLFLYNESGVVGLYTTGNGQFYFPGLVTGKYTLTAAPPAGYTPAGPPTFELDLGCDAIITQNILLSGGVVAPTPTNTRTPTTENRITPVASQQGTPRASTSGSGEGTSNFKPFTVAAVYDIGGCGSLNAPGLYRLAASLTSQWDCIQINSDNVIFDCQGYALNGTEWNGYGVVVHQIGNVLSQRPARNIEIRNCKSEKHKYGIFIDAADNLYIHDNELTNHFRDTDERNFGQFLGLAEGGGIRIGSTTNALIANNQTNESAIGIDVRNGSGITVRGNNAHANTAWGIHFYNVQFSEVSNNTTTDNLRYCTWGNGTVGAGCDAGGIMLQSGSSRNVIKDNVITGANGNGIFIKAHGTACGDGNTISGNTISGSLYNAVELSFCRDNKIEANKISGSLDGIWLGFATNNALVGNQIQDLANHGIISWNSSDNNISTNTIINSREGLYFYTGEYDREQFFFVQGSPEDHISRGNCLCDNTLLNNAVAAIHLNNSLRNQITQNRLTNNGINFVMEGNTAGNIIQDNIIEGGSYHFGAPRPHYAGFAKPSALTAYSMTGRVLSDAEFRQTLLTDSPHDSFDLRWFKLKLRISLGLTTVPAE